MRNDKESYYLEIAESVAKRGTCLRRNYGAIIVKNDSIIATGYTGAPRGRKNCCDVGYCVRTKLNVPRGQRYELCRSVHAEANAIISASRENMIGATMYVFGIDYDTQKPIYDADSCSMCKRLIINAGITRVMFKIGEGITKSVDVRDWIFKDYSLEGEFGY